jgi:hypothetical protein
MRKMVKHSTKLLIRKFYLIHCFRFFIEEKLNELNLTSNEELQRFYINDFILQKHIKLMAKFNDSRYFKTIPRINNEKTKKLIKKTFSKLLSLYTKDPWIIKSPHIKKKKINKKIYHHKLEKIEEVKVKIINI